MTAATFDTAVVAAHGGDTLRLVGTFADERLVNRDFTTPFTIDASHATFRSLTLENVQNLTVLGGTFNIAGAPQYTRAIGIYGGRNVTINGVKVIGTSGGEGVVFDHTLGATLTNSSFRGLQVAAVLGSVTAGSVSRNVVTGALSDGFDIANSHGVTAANNTCSGGAPALGSHPDCIQLWSVTGNALQSDIVVRNNVATGATQGFTAFASMGGELRVQIIHNTVDSSYPQGIACYDCVDSSISYNRVSTMAGANYRTSVSVVDGINDTVVGNYIAPYNRPSASPFATAFTADALGIGAFGGSGPDVAPDLSALVGTPSVPVTTAVPEPSDWALLMVGFVGVGLIRRRAARLNRAVAA